MVGRTAVAGTLLGILLGTGPAHAQVPFRLSVWGGVGSGTGHRGGLTFEDGVGTNDGLQLAWLRSPTWSLTAAVETAHTFGTRPNDEATQLEDVRAQLVTAGVEYEPRLLGEPFLIRVAAGAGRILNDTYRYEGPRLERVRVGPSWDGAVAGTAALGARRYVSRSLSLSVMGQVLAASGGPCRMAVVTYVVGVSFGAPFDAD